MAAMRIRTISRHLFGLRTFAPIIGSGLSGYVALMQMHMSIDDADFWLLLLGGLAAGIISWSAIAYDGWKKEIEKGEWETRHQEILDAIKADLAYSHPIPAHIANPQSISNQQMKNRVAALATRMRQFETNSSATTPTMPGGITPDTPPLEADKIWQPYVQKLHVHREDRLYRFLETLRPEALALRNEMYGRLGKMLDPKNPDMVLDLGLLTGINPIANAASGLESLARDLPD